MTSKGPASPTPRRARLSAPQRQAQIIAAARAIALEHGLAAVTLRAVAAQVGVAPALVAHYVPAMDGLVADTFADIVGDELRDVSRLVSTGDGVSRIRTLLATLLDGGREDVTLVWVQSWALGGRNEVLAAKVREQMDAWEEMLAAVVAVGVSDGDFSVEEPRAVAGQLLGMIDGLNAHVLVRWRDTTGRRRTMATSAEAILGLPRGALDPFAVTL